MPDSGADIITLVLLKVCSSNNESTRGNPYVITVTIFGVPVFFNKNDIW
jgi:hypothetical protein